jgi:hypothetical protein
LRSSRRCRKRRAHQPPLVDAYGRLFRNAAHPENRDQARYRLILRNHPASFVKNLGKLPEGAQVAERLSGNANVIVYFTDRLAELQEGFRTALGCAGSRWHALDRLAQESQRPPNRPDGRHRAPRWIGMWACGRKSLRDRRDVVRIEVCDSSEGQKSS